MKRIAWLTDIHLNFIKIEAVAGFCQRILAGHPDLVIISGDIAESHNLIRYLTALEAGLQMPIYFVLGNHDFYRSSISSVRADVAALCHQSHWLHWLPLEEVVELTPTTGLLGHDAWADGRYGDYFNSPIRLNDYLLIRDLSGLHPHDRLKELQALGDEAADYFRGHLPAALDRFPKMLLVMHPPPFREACWYMGRQSSDDWLPHMGCKAVGDVLLELMRPRSDRHLTVLCGHTHGKGVAAILPNLEVRTGGAEYGAPQVQEYLTVT